MTRRRYVTTGDDLKISDVVINASGLAKTSDVSEAIQDAVSGIVVEAPEGRSVELQATSTHVQWRYVGDVAWIDLIPLATLTGANGLSVELQTTATHIQWRQAGGVWADLVALAALTGPPGAASNVPGPQGPPGDLTAEYENLFDASASVLGYHIGGAGVIYANANYAYSAPITVDAGQVYTLSADYSGSQAVAAWYTAADAFISLTASTGTAFTAPANAAFMRLNISYLDAPTTWPLLMLVKGTVVPPEYVPFGATLAPEVRTDNTTLLAQNAGYDRAYFTHKPFTKTGDGLSSEISLGAVIHAGHEGQRDIYVSAKASVSGAGCIALELWHPTSATVIATVPTPTAGVEYMLSGVLEFVLTTNVAHRTINVRARYADAAAQAGQVFTASKGNVLILTEIFGAGHEPTADDMDALLARFPDRWFPGAENIFAADMGTMLRATALKPCRKGAASLGIHPDGYVAASSAVNSTSTHWAPVQRTYGQAPTLAPVPHQIHGTVETDGMFSVIAKFGRWTKNIVTAGAHLFGGHVFEAWNNIGTYRLTFLMGENGREDEACIQVFSPTGAHATPMYPTTAEQDAARITQNVEDYFSPNAYFGRIRIGSDAAGQGTVFQKMKTTVHGEFVLARQGGAPASATATGERGQIIWTGDHLYICIATNTWKRVALTSW